MKTKLLLLIILVSSGLAYSQEKDGQNRPLIQFNFTAPLKDNAKQDSIKLTSAFDQYKQYNNLFKHEYSRLNGVHDVKSHSAIFDAAEKYKYSRDSVYFTAMKLKTEYIAAGSKKSKLDTFFPDDVSKVDEKPENKGRNKFMYLNAIDFDFAKSKSGYVGHLNFYAPCEEKFGFAWNAGFLKINYTSKDSIIANRQDNILLNPLDEPGVGSQYVRQYNTYKVKAKNASYSIYMQPLLKLTAKKNKNLIFAHLHGELLISKLTQTIEINNIAKDTVTIDIPEEIPSRFTPYMTTSQTISKTFISGNFGGGLTFDLFFSEKSSLFVQGTVGYTTNYPHAASVNSLNINNVESRKFNSFYLWRAYYRHKVTDSSELILATDIRGLFPRYEPYYSIYVGLNLSVEKIADLFK